MTARRMRSGVGRGGRLRLRGQAGVPVNPTAKDSRCFDVGRVTIKPVEHVPRRIRPQSGPPSRAGGYAGRPSSIC